MSFLFAVPGLIMQVVGQGMMGSPQGAAVGGLLMLFGTALLLVGFALYAMSRGRSPAWCLCGFMSIIGLLILASLEDRAPEKKI